MFSHQGVRYLKILGSVACWKKCVTWVGIVVSKASVRPSLFLIESSDPTGVPLSEPL